MDLSQQINDHSKSGPPSLTGSDVKSDITKIQVLEVFETGAEFNSPFGLKFKPKIKSVQPERGELDTYYPNKTSAKSIVKMFGADSRKLIGKTLKLVRIPRTNPTTNKQTMGLQVMEEVK